MVAISYPSKQSNSNSNERRVILIGFDNDHVKAILAEEDVTKLVIFDDTDTARVKFEKVYPVYRDRITLYEGDIESNINGYFQLREKEGITPEMHRVEVHNDHLPSFN